MENTSPHIHFYGTLLPPPVMLDCAQAIKYQNYKTNTPKKFQVLPLHTKAGESFMADLSALIQVDNNKLDYVYFSVCKGAEPHVDLLDPAVFEDRTFVIPIILPKGKSVITAQDTAMVVELNGVYEFNHEKVHSMQLEDCESGCVVVMVAIKKALSKRYANGQGNQRKLVRPRV